MVGRGRTFLGFHTVVISVYWGFSLACAVWTNTDHTAQRLFQRYGSRITTILWSRLWVFLRLRYGVVYSISEREEQGFTPPDFNSLARITLKFHWLSYDDRATERSVSSHMKKKWNFTKNLWNFADSNWLILLKQLNFTGLGGNFTEFPVARSLQDNQLNVIGSS